MTVGAEALLEAEEAAWHELHDELDRLTDEEMERPGLTPDGWSVKDVVFHIGAWAADCGVQLERMRMGTWEEPHEDVERQNREWFELSRTMDLRIVKAEFAAARTRKSLESSAVMKRPFRVPSMATLPRQPSMLLAMRPAAPS